MRWTLSIGLPSILIWVIGMPFLGFCFLKSRRDKLLDPVFFGRFRMIYQGLKPSVFYWEFVNIIRKTFLVSVNVFLNLYSSTFKALLSLLVLVIFLRV